MVLSNNTYFFYISIFWTIPANLQRINMKKILKRFTNFNKWSYFMNIAFGLSLLIITLQFQFAKTTIVIDDPPAIIKLDNGYITEKNQAIRIIEGIISLGLIGLGVERLINAKRKPRNS